MIPDHFIYLVNICFGKYEKDSGGCLKFHYLLKYVFPDAEGWYNSNHVVTKIGDRFFDIDGEFCLDDSYLSFVDFGEHNIQEQFKNTYIMKNNTNFKITVLDKGFITTSESGKTTAYESRESLEKSITQQFLEYLFHQLKKPTTGEIHVNIDIIVNPPTTA